MNVEINGQSYYRTAKSYVIEGVSHFNQHRKWIHCPRCIGGTMYREHNGEYVCIQCGCSCYPNTVTKTPKVSEECVTEAGNMPDKFH